ncbi:pyridoxamine 5'-phosphate oxidase family protein [Desulfobacula sp.]
MEKEIKDKARSLIHDTRVMTLAVSDKDIPWSSPVYFVFHDNLFYFFSNENSRHISCVKGEKIVSASVFHDSDQMELIFGIQMSGRVKKISKNSVYLMVVRKYVTKFSFLKQIFGPGIVENKNFFLEKFKTHLFCFYPDIIFLSDNSKTTEQRLKINLNKIT